jgi:hypothetical protein
VNEAYSKVHTGKNMSATFPIQNVVDKEMLYRHSFFKFALEDAIREA